VLKAWRGRGVGTLLVGALVAGAADLGLAEVDLNSQTHAVAFYAKLGFAVRGDAFVEAGIPHQNMVMRVPR